MKGRMQVVVCRVCSSGGGVLDADRLIQSISETPGVGSAIVVDRLCDKNTVASLVQEAKDKEVDRLLVIPCSREDLSPFVLQAYRKKAKINDYLIETVDLVNEVVLPHMNDREGAQAKAETKLLASIARLSLLQPLEKRSDEMRTKNVVVIGAGVAGLAAADQAARAGMHTVILEKTDRPTKAPGVVMPKSKIIAATGEAGNYVLTIEAGKKIEKLECAAIVIASGGDWADARGPLGSVIRPSRPWALPLSTREHAISTVERIQPITATQSGIGRLRVGDMLIVGQEGRP